MQTLLLIESNNIFFPHYQEDELDEMDRLREWYSSKEMCYFSLRIILSKDARHT